MKSPPTSPDSNDKSKTVVQEDDYNHSEVEQEYPGEGYEPEKMQSPSELGIKDPSLESLKKILSKNSYHDAEQMMEEEESEAVAEDVKSFYDFSEQSKQYHKENKFVECAKADFVNMNEMNIFESVLECPALLAISDSGALDLSKWVDNFLLSKGLPAKIAREGVLLGEMKDWSFVEELQPSQMIQV